MSIWDSCQCLEICSHMCLFWIDERVLLGQVFTGECNLRNDH